MKTYFASAERATKEDLIASIKMANESPVLSGVLLSVGGLLAILNENRQILAVNDSFLKLLGIDALSETLGLRPGEALNCIHSAEEPGGCGTSKFCSTCGAAIAIVSSLNGEMSSERICAITFSKDGKTGDIALCVKSQKIEINGEIILLLFLQDITVQQQRAALERAFFHDINNMLSGLVGATELLFLENNQSDLVKSIYNASLRLMSELDIQKCLLDGGADNYQPFWQTIAVDQVIDELKSCFNNHSAKNERTITFQPLTLSLSIKTDVSLLLRILSNMLTNALESTDKSGTVKLWVENDDDFLNFSVWNSKYIEKEISSRIFQRNFSTKDGSGRGIGTYSMKLFTTQILDGKIDFTTSEKEGTTFTLSLPIR